jgi:hypothetical protein
LRNSDTPGLPQVGIDDVLIARDLGGCSFGDQFARIEDDYPIRDSKDRLDEVLDLTMVTPLSRMP